AHRSGRAAGVPARARQVGARLVSRAVHAGHEPFHAGVGHQACRGHLASECCGDPSPHRGHHLSAHSHRRRAHAPFYNRAIADTGVLCRAGARNHQPAVDGVARPEMDIFILIGSFTVVCLLGMPVAYALGLAAILAALWVDIPLEAVMLKVSGGMSGFSLLAIPFFILAGAIMAVGGAGRGLVTFPQGFLGFLPRGLARGYNRPPPTFA